MPALRWRGLAIVASLEAAAKVAVDETTAAAADYAKTNHTWESESGALEGAITSQPARVEAGRIVGQFGAWDVIEAAKQELGTAMMPARPYLRPAGDAESPDLAKRMREHWLGI